jgi:thioredoxin-related protein
MMIRTYLLFIVVFSTAVSCKPDKTGMNPGTASAPSEQMEEADTFSVLLKKAVAQNKSVFIVFGFHACGWCQRFEEYHHDPGVKRILDRYFLVTYIDYSRTPGGKDLYARFAGAGAPSWSIFEPSGRVIINSEAPQRGVKNGKSNIGYPKGNYNINYYLQALKKGAPGISSGECALLARKLQEYNGSGER